MNQLKVKQASSLFLCTGTALIGFGQAAEATVHEDPIRNFANNLGISNKAYDTASEASSAVDTVANMSEHATEAEERVISYETDVYSVYTKGAIIKHLNLIMGHLLEMQLVIIGELL